MSWTQFFKEAGIPSTVAKRYSVIFEENRITKDLLSDLSKEILFDMGIKVMGDILCILKHAKKEMTRTETSDSGLHSTMHSDPVSTTSGGGKRREVPRGQMVTSPSEYNLGDVQGVLQMESQQSDIMPTLRSDQILLESPTQVEYEEHGITESYSTAAYEKTKQKRPATMYSDEADEYSPTKQPRVIVLPGERGQEMYTATALQRAAAIAAASVAIVAQEESPTSQQRSRKILEATGFASPEDKSSGGSVFSRLDGDPSSSHVSASRRAQSPPLTRVTIDTSKPRIAVDTSKQRIAVDTSQPKRITIDTSKPRTIKLAKEHKAVGSTSDIKITTKGRKTSITDRLGEVSSSKHIERESSGLRSAASSESQPLRVRLGDKKRSVVSSSTSARKPAPKTMERETPMSMVADEMDYQTRRQRDIRSRLELKEKEKAARRRGPLSGRLERHHVFGRLE